MDVFRSYGGAVAVFLCALGAAGVPAWAQGTGVVPGGAGSVPLQELDRPRSAAPMPAREPRRDMRKQPRRNNGPAKIQQQTTPNR